MSEDKPPRQQTTNWRDAPPWLINQILRLREWGGYSEDDLRRVFDGEMRRLIENQNGQ